MMACDGFSETPAEASSFALPDGAHPFHSEKGKEGKTSQLHWRGAGVGVGCHPNTCGPPGGSFCHPNQVPRTGLRQALLAGSKRYSHVRRQTGGLEANREQQAESGAQHSRPSAFVRRGGGPSGRNAASCLLSSHRHTGRQLHLPGSFSRQPHMIMSAL